MCPRPSSPTVLPSSSEPVVNCQRPLFTLLTADVKWRLIFRMCISATSATAAEFAPITLATGMPHRAAAAQSMLSRPMPYFWSIRTLPRTFLRASSSHFSRILMTTSACFACSSTSSGALPGIARAIRRYFPANRRSKVERSILSGSRLIQMVSFMPAPFLSVRRPILAAGIAAVSWAHLSTGRRTLQHFLKKYFHFVGLHKFIPEILI